jgi:hypothetical protein
VGRPSDNRLELINTNMPVEAHPVFAAPANLKARIWRYTDLAKFLSVFDRSALFFPRLDKLDDPFEGSYTKSILTFEDVKFDDLSNDLRVQIGNEEAFRNIVGSNRQFREFAKTLREITFVNSWYCNEHESAAMWSQYLRTQEGIAIQSTYERLCKALAGYEEFQINLGMVNYIDYESDSIPFGNAIYLTMYKRKSFEHERELRAVIWTMQHGKNMPGSENKFKDEPGLYVSVDIPTLVERVYLAPTAPSWLRDLIDSLLKRFGHEIPVVQSSLADKAFY